MAAPVVVFVYNRPDHAKATLEALNNNRLASETDLFIYADNAKSEAGQAKVDATRHVADSFALNNNFHSVSVIKAEKNKGLANSVISGVTDVIKKYGRVIVVEDDHTTSADFLEYMNNALDFYEHEDKIWSISAYTPYLSRLKNYSHDVYMCYRGSSWGWATWLDRWENIDWKVSDYNDLMNSKKRIKQFNRGGSDMTGMLADWHEGRNNSWAIRWCYAQSCADKLTVYPKESRITNTGCDNSGTHSGSTTRYETPFKNDHPACSFEMLPVDKKLMQEYRLIFDFSHLGKLKRSLIRMFAK